MQGSPHMGQMLTVGITGVWKDSSKGVLVGRVWGYTHWARTHRGPRDSVFSSGEENDFPKRETIEVSQIERFSGLSKCPKRLWHSWADGTVEGWGKHLNRKSPESPERTSLRSKTCVTLSFHPMHSSEVCIEVLSQRTWTVWVMGLVHFQASAPVPPSRTATGGSGERQQRTELLYIASILPDSPGPLLCLWKWCRVSEMSGKGEPLSWSIWFIKK